MHEGEEVTVRYTVLGNPGNRMSLSATLRKYNRQKIRKSSNGLRRNLTVSFNR